MFVRPPLRNGAALAQEQAITDTMLQATAECMLTPSKSVRNGTMKMPLAIPSAPPNALAPMDTTKRYTSDSACMPPSGGPARAGIANREDIASPICPSGFGARGDSVDPGRLMATRVGR